MNALIGSCILSLCPRHKTTPLYDISRLYGSPMHKLLGEGKEVISSVDKIQNKTTGPTGSNLQLKANSFPLQKFLWITCTFIQVLHLLAQMILAYQFLCFCAPIEKIFAKDTPACLHKGFPLQSCLDLVSLVLILLPGNFHIISLPTVNSY